MVKERKKGKEGKKISKDLIKLPRPSEGIVCSVDYVGIFPQLWVVSPPS